MKAPALLRPSRDRLEQPLLAEQLEVDGRRYFQLPLVDEFAVARRNAYPVALYEPDRTAPSVSHRDDAGTLQIAYDQLTLVGWMLHLPWATNPVSLNRGGKRGGWRQDAAANRAVRELAFSLALNRIPRQKRIRVRLDWHVSTVRTRDEDNLMRAMKHLVDGLRLAGVVDDDNRTYVLRDMPTIPYRSPADGGYAHMRLYVWITPPAMV